MPNDIVNPLQPDPTPTGRDEHNLGDMVACYGGDTTLKRHWVGQQGQVRAVSGDLLTVAFIPEVAADLSTLVFHKKQVRKLKQAGGRVFWINQNTVENVKVGEEKPFQVLATYKPQDEPTWLRFEQQTVEYEED